MHLLKQPCHFSLHLQGFEHFVAFNDSSDSNQSTPYSKFNALPGVLQSKFIRKAMAIEPVMWCKYQNVFVYKSYAIVKVFRDQNTL